MTISPLPRLTAKQADVVGALWLSPDPSMVASPDVLPGGARTINSLVERDILVRVDHATRVALPAAFVRDHYDALVEKFGHRAKPDVEVVEPTSEPTPVVEAVEAVEVVEVVEPTPTFFETLDLALRSDGLDELLDHSEALTRAVADLVDRKVAERTEALSRELSEARESLRAATTAHTQRGGRERPSPAPTAPTTPAVETPAPDAEMQRFAALDDVSRARERLESLSGSFEVRSKATGRTATYTLKRSDRHDAAAFVNAGEPGGKSSYIGMLFVESPEAVERMPFSAPDANLEAYRARMAREGGERVFKFVNTKGAQAKGFDRDHPLVQIARLVTSRLSAGAMPEKFEVLV